MGRTRGSKNRKKSDSNGLGHNSGDDAPISAGDEAPGPVELTDEQRQVLTFQWKRRYADALGAKKLADAALKDVAKKARVDLGPQAVSDIKDLIELQTPEGEAAFLARRARQERIRRWMSLPEGTEGDLFEDRTPAVDRAFDEGKRACMNGEPKKPPHDPSVPQYSSWMSGYQHAEAVILSGLKPFDRPWPDDPDAENLLAPPSEENMAVSDKLANPRMKRSEWKAHLARQNAEVAADIKAASIGTEPATAWPLKG